MSRKPRVAIASTSFSKSSTLLEELGALQVEVIPNTSGHRLSETELVEFLNGAEADIAVIGLEPVSARVLGACPRLRLVSKYGVGLDNIDQDALKNAGVRLSWCPGVNRRSVTELTLAFALGHLRNVTPSVVNMRAGIWQKNGGRQLSNAVVGIVGLGNVGSDVAQILRAFSTRVLFCDVADRTLVAGALELEERTYEDMLPEVDVLSFHVPSTELTRGMFGSSQIERMRRTALIINTARGDIVEFDATVAAVKEGRLGGFATDVYPEEPLDGSPYADAANLYFTPHIGGNAREAILAMGRAAIAGVADALRGGVLRND